MPAPVWTSPKDWATGDRLRARDLNRDLGDNVRFLRERIPEQHLVYPNADVMFTDNTQFLPVGAAYRITLLLQDTSNVMLIFIPGRLRGSGTQNIDFDWRRDNTVFLSSQAPTPATSGLFSVRVQAADGYWVGNPVFWWDVGVPAGEHYWDLMVRSSVGYIDNSDMPFQVMAIGW